MIKNFIKYTGKSNRISVFSLAKISFNNTGQNNNLSIKLYSERLIYTSRSSVNMLENAQSLIDFHPEEIDSSLKRNMTNLKNSTLDFSYSRNDHQKADNNNIQNNFNKIYLSSNKTQLFFSNRNKITKTNLNSQQKQKTSNKPLLITKPSTKSFSLYIPHKKLTFTKHAKHGSVYPVYIADTEHYRRSNPNKLMPLIALFSSVNLFVCLTGFRILPMTKLYELLFFSDTTVFFSALFNIFLVKKYIDFLIKYRHRVKNLFLLPSGTQIIIEAFDGTQNTVEIQDIFERRVYLRYEGTQKDSVFTNNDNSFRANIGWGFNKENYFEGKRKFMDYEVLHQIIHRNNIDTTQVKFKAPEIPLNFLTPEEKRIIIRRFSGRKILEKFDFRNFKLTYFLYKKRLFDDRVVFIRNYRRKKNLEQSKNKSKIFSRSSNSALNFKPNEEEKLKQKILKEKSKMKVLSFYD